MNRKLISNDKFAVYRVNDESPGSENDTETRSANPTIVPTTKNKQTKQTNQTNQTKQNERRSHVVPVKHELFPEEDFLKSCPDYDYMPTVLPPVPRIIVIGDVHGDLQLAIKSFEIAKLVDKELNWIADPQNTVVVQVGDQVDSCRPINGVYDCHSKRQKNDSADDTNVIDFFNKMHEKAKKVGGQVLSLLGNHELMNVEWDFRYVSYDNFYNFKYEVDGVKYEGPSGRKDAFKPGGDIAKLLACQRNAVIVVGSNMFIHAGILPALVEKIEHMNIDDQTKLTYINSIVRKWLLNKVIKKDEKNILSYFLNDAKVSPFWARVFGMIPTGVTLDSGECDNSVKKILNFFKLGQIIVGHTPQLMINEEGINGTCVDSTGKNRLYRVDGGFSKGFKIWSHSNLVQVLEILNDNTFNIISDEGTTNIDEIPDVGIMDTYMPDVAKIYAQNRVKSDSKSDSNSNSKSDSKSKSKSKSKKYQRHQRKFSMY